MGRVEFTGNYEDLSTDKGFQFKFNCEKCGNGFMSTYKVNKLGLAASAAEIASSFFGGMFGRAAHGAYEAQRAIGGKAHDEALSEAVAEIKPLFKQCTRCGKYICEKFCWNAKQQLCERCAPDIDEEVAAAQMEAASALLPPSCRRSRRRPSMGGRAIRYPSRSPAPRIFESEHR